MIVRGRRRTGFTLIELLVVVTILGILIALSIGGAMRVYTAQQIRSSQDVVEKVQVAVDKQYKAIIDQAKMDIRTQSQPDAIAIIGYMAGDPDAALALLSYCRIRQFFPQTFAEVTPFPVGGFVFPVKSQFLAFQGATDPTNNYYKQSALLLHAAVAQTGAGGQTFTAEATNAANMQLTLGTASGTVYMDTWQQPVGFCRFGTNPELQAVPYVNANTNVASVDPLDPAGKLSVYWLQGNIPNNGAGLTALSIFCQTNDIANATSFNGTNRRPVVYSIGPNFVYESLNQATGTTNDDILGYRLTQLGYKGTQ